MPISAEQWRVSIQGCCYTNIIVVSRNVVRCSPWSILLDLSPLISSFSVMGGVHKKTNDSRHSLLTAFLLIIVSCLLLRSGNVELNPGPLDQLTLKNLRLTIWEARTKWEDIGIELNLGPTTLEAIKIENHGIIKNCLTAMLKEWLKQTSPHPTWSALVEALKQPTVGCSQLAEQIRKKYIDPPPVGESTCASNHPDQQLITETESSSETSASDDIAVKPSTDNENGALKQLTSTEQKKHIDVPPPSSSSEGERRCATMINNPPDQQLITETESTSSKDTLNQQAVEPSEPTKSQRSHNVPQTSSSTRHIKERKSTDTEVKRLEKEFLRLVRCTYDALVQNNVGATMLCAHTSTLGISLKKEHQDFIDEYLLSMNEGTTLTDLWVRLNKYWDFLNYTLLEHVIENFGSENLQSQMETYVTDLKEFRETTRVCDFINCWSKKGVSLPETELQEFVLKMDRSWQHTTLEDLEELKRMITHKFFLPSFVLILKEATPGSFVITWIIPTPIAAALREDIENMGDREFFKKHQVDLITINGQECYYSPVKKYAAYLKGVYSSKEGKNLAPFKLARIEKRQVNHQTMDSFTRSSIRGDMDDVVYDKYPLTESEIGWIDYYDSRKHVQIQRKPKLVLIEGAPGVGKTTFSSQFCYKWSQGQVLQEYSLLVLLPLRDNRVKSAKTIADLFHHSKQTVVQEIEKSQGEGIILWLEGFDELDEDLRTKSSVFFDLIHGTILPNATIFVTSRPWASQEIVKKISEEIDQHIELLTTPKIQLDRVLRGTTLTTPLAKLFIEYISSNAAILAAMHTPITADIAVEVLKWSQETDSSPPTTMTQLYTTFTLKLLTQHLSNKGGRWKKFHGFDDLPDDVYKQFLSLCELAYNGLLKQQLVFSDLPSEFKSLGLMKTVEQLYGDDDHTHHSYNFIHLTLQEYLAAFYISRFPSQEQTALIHQHHISSHFKMTLRFLAGITHLANLTPVLTQQLHVQRNDKLTLFHWLFEASDVSIVTTILGEDEMRVHSSYSWTPLDFYVTGYCLSLSNCGWDLWFIRFIDDDGLKMFSRGMLLNSEAKCRGYISRAWFGGHIIDRDTITVAGMRWFVQLPQRVFHGLRSLELSNNKLSKETVTLLAEVIPVMTSLEKLDISSNPSIGNGGAVDLFKSLCSNNKTLRELDLTDTGIGEDDSIVLGELLSCCNLTILRFNKMSSDSVTPILTGLNKNVNNSLEFLDMGSLQLTFESIAPLSSALQQPQCQLETLYIVGCTMTSEGAVKLATGLTNNHSLKGLDLSKTSIGDDGAVALANMLSVNKHIEKLNVSCCNITSQGAAQLATVLSNKKSTLMTLLISGNTIGPSGVAAFAKMIQENKSLVELELHDDDSLGEEGVHQLISAMINNTTLRQLVLPQRYTTQVDDHRIRC